MSALSLEQGEIRIGKRRLTLSNLDKVYYPEVGFTKGQVIDYYARVAEVLLPHLKDRPLTLKRYPEGAAGPFFFEKRCPPWRPSWVKTAHIPGVEANDISFCLANDLPTLLWAANLGDLELHTGLARARAPDRPTAMVFDLDPGAPATMVQCCQVALWLRELLEQSGLRAWAKTSGSKGLQLYVPLNGAQRFEETRAFAHAAADLLSEQHPGKVTAKIGKAERRGRVLIDWNQNHPNRTMVCVYSLRAKSRPSISTPVTWEEVERAARSRAKQPLAFGPEAALARIEAEGDLFAPVLTVKQRLPRLH